MSALSVMHLVLIPGARRKPVTMEATRGEIEKAMIAMGMRSMSYYPDGTGEVRLASRCMPFTWEMKP